jgi:hypothetical protein
MARTGPAMTRRRFVSAARRFGKPAEDVEDVRLRSRLYSATSRPALLTYPRPLRRAPCGRDWHLVRGASAIGRDRLTTEERLSDIVEILAHGLLWLDVPIETAQRQPRSARMIVSSFSMA